jgi:hypothetical protein
MDYKFQYKTEEEKQIIIKENSSKYLVEYQNITEGNFLIFSDQKPQNLEDINNNLLTVMNAIADLYSVLPQ